MGPAEDTIPEIVRAMATAFSVLPVAVYYGRERFSRQIVTDNRIEIEQVGPEVYGPSMGTGGGSNPTVGARTLAVQVLIEAKSDRAGADENDHKRLANWFADLVWSFFLEEAQSRGEPVENWAASGGFTERPGDEREVGCRYVLSFSVGRSVKRVEEMLVSDLSALGITLAGATRVTIGDQTETVCGV